MGFKDQLQKLMQPFEGEDEDIYEGARKNASAPAAAPAVKTIDPGLGFEQFAADEPEFPEEEEVKAERKPMGEGNFLGGFKKAAAKPRVNRERTVDFGGQEMQAILFSPKNFTEATGLIAYLEQRRSLVLTLEGGTEEEPRRLLDFISGITVALHGKITPISKLTYFITPQEVNVLGANGELAESDGRYL